MTTSAWLTLVAIFLGPISAVIVTLWIESRRKSRDAKLILLRLLLSTRDLPADSNFQTAIKLIPVEYNDSPRVLLAHREFLEAAKVLTQGKSETDINSIIDNTSVKLTRLLYQMSLSVGLKIQETDIQTGAFGTDGFYYRDQLAQDSQRAMREVANILWMQTRLMAGESWEQISAPAQPVEPVEKEAARPKGKGK